MDQYRIGVVGASGCLGGIIHDRASILGIKVVPLSIRQLQENTDAQDPANEFRGLNAVVFAAPLTTNSLHCLALKAGCHVVDVGISEQSIADALALDSLAKAQDKVVVVMAGLAPGLSGLIGLELGRRFESAVRVDVTLLQNSSGTAGKQGVCDMLDMLTNRERSSIVSLSNDSKTASLVASNYLFELPTPEQHLLDGYRDSLETRYLTAFDSSAMNWQIRILRLIRSISSSVYRFIRDRVAVSKSKQASPQDESISLIGSAYGREGVELGREHIRLVSDYGATADVALTMANMAAKGELAPGAGHPSNFTDWPTIKAVSFASK